tara:strand:- start:183 stop:371 length:189 start_codon:yes stop_codon:yes gene_type:complete
LVYYSGEEDASTVLINTQGFSFESYFEDSSAYNKEYRLPSLKEIDEQQKKIEQLKKAKKYLK